MGLLNSLLDLIFPRSRYGKPGLTRHGVQVRSRAEHRIAAYFDSIRLSYTYEKELKAGFWIFKRKVSCPDFYLSNYDVYVEYWGMVDVPDPGDREKYTRTMRYKLARYRELGIKFISLHPADLKNLDVVFREKFKEVTGVDLKGP